MGSAILRKYLDDNNETQTAFAERAGVATGALSDWLAGKRGPDVTSAVAIAKATNNVVPVESWVRHNDGRRHESETKQAS
jgi:transcriptional regulator with XRE-family HTH domain